MLHYREYRDAHSRASYDMQQEHFRTPRAYFDET